MKTGNIWCVGRNYVNHAKELGNEIPTSPLIFLKASACYHPAHDPIILPSWSQNLHYEGELVIGLGDQLEPSHYGLGLDLTARDVQSQAKKKGHPWTLAKSFTSSCPVSELRPLDSIDLLSSYRFELKLNGQTKQVGDTSLMIFSIGTLLDYLKQHFPLCPGDLIMTGTPEGVGQVRSGDQIELSDPLGLKASFQFK